MNGKKRWDMLLVICLSFPPMVVLVGLFVTCSDESSYCYYAVTVFQLTVCNSFLVGIAVCTLPEFYFL